MEIKETEFKDLFIIKHKFIKDSRGYFKESFRKNILEKKVGYKIDFCQENLVKSNMYVLRGLHFQKDPFSQSKLINVISGKILDVAVDLRKNSKTYGKYFLYELFDGNHESIFIPKGFAHGYLTLSKIALINYKVDNYFNKNAEGGIMFNDDKLGINWGLEENKMIISEKDKNQSAFNEI